MNKTCGRGWGESFTFFGMRLLGLTLAWACLVWGGFVSASAQTHVSGVITTDTTWRAADGPYLVDGDLTVLSGAVLTVQAGTEVQLAPGTALVVQAGALRALGSATQRVRFTSQRVATASAARGDWRGVRIEAGGSGSRFEYTDIDYGRGVQIDGATVAFMHTRLRFNEGAAIQIDLASSLSGEGNQAADNDLNAVSVPAGVISGAVNWSLRGIAFHVAGGAVSVGVSPAVTHFAPSALAPGSTTTVTVSGSRLRGADQVRFDKPGLSATVLPTVTDSKVELSVSVAADAPTGAARMTVRTDAGEVTATDPITVLAPTLTLDPASAKVVKGQPLVLTLNLPAPAPDGGVVVDLASSVPGVGTVPAQVTVASGSSSQSVTFTALDYGNTTLTASHATLGHAAANVEVIAPPKLTLAPATLGVGMGRSANLTITASAPAPVGGLSVGLVSSNEAVARVGSASVTLVEGSTSTTATVQALALGTTTVTASATGFESASTTVHVREVALTLPASALVAPALTRSIPITLTDPAPTGGLIIALSSSNTSVLTVPATVTVPEGQSAINVSLTGGVAGIATLSASAAGYVGASTAVTVETVTLGLGVSSISLPQGMKGGPYTVTLSKPAPAGGVRVELAVANTAVATVSLAEVLIPEGQTSAPLTRPEVNALTKGSTTLTLSASGLSTLVVPITVTDPLELRFGAQRDAAKPITLGKGFKTYMQEVWVRQYSGGSTYNGPAAVTVKLASSDPAKVSVPATVTIPSGQSQVYFEVSALDFTGGTPVTINASVDGYASPAVLLQVEVVAPTYKVCGAQSTRTVVSTRDDVSLCYEYNAHPNLYYPLSPHTALTVDWSVADDVPVGLMPGYFSASTGGSAVMQTTWAAGSSSSNSAYAATPTVAGSYKVRGGIAGLATVDSGVVTVGAPELRFGAQRDVAKPVVLGKGFKTHATSFTGEVFVIRFEGSSTFSGAIATTVKLTSSDPAKVSVPATVTIPSGQSHVYFQVSALDFTGGTPVTISASADGYTSSGVLLQVEVVAPAYKLCGVESTRTVVSGRDSVALCYGYNAHSNLYYPLSPFADLAVDWSVTDDVPVGLMPGYFSAVTGGSAITQTTWGVGLWDSGSAYAAVPTVAGSYKVRAGVAGLATVDSGAVTVSAPELRFGVFRDVAKPLVLGKGFKTYVQEVWVAQYAGSSLFTGTTAVTVRLTSSDPAKVSVPATVTIPAGQYQVTFEISAVDFTGSTPVTISASADGYTSPTTLLKVEVVTPAYKLCGVDSARTVFDNRDAHTLCYSNNAHPNVYYPLSPHTTLTVDWNVADDVPVGLMPGYFSASTGGSAITQTTWAAAAVGGSSSSSDPAWAATPVAVGSYKVRAGVAGLATVTSDSVTVTTPELRFVNPSGSPLSTLYLGRGLKTYETELRVRRYSAGRALSGTEPVTVNLTCTSTAVCRVPASVTIPAGTAETSVIVEGVDLGSTTITAWATGYTSPPDLSVITALPNLRFNSLGSVAVGKTRSISVNLCVPSAFYGCSYTAIDAFNIDLQSLDPAIAMLPASTRIEAGANTSPNFNLTGVAPGTTTINASGPGVNSTSANVTVTP